MAINGYRFFYVWVENWDFPKEGSFSLSKLQVLKEKIEAARMKNIIMRKDLEEIDSQLSNI